MLWSFQGCLFTSSFGRKQGNAYTLCHKSDRQEGAEGQGGFVGERDPGSAKVTCFNQSINQNDYMLQKID